MGSKASTIAVISIALCFHVQLALSEVINLDGQTSIVDLRPWLFLRTDHHTLKLTDALDTLTVQHPYEFELQIHNASLEKVSYQLVFGGNSVMADWVSINGLVYSFPGNSVKLNIEAGSDMHIRFRLPELDRMASGRLFPQLLTPLAFEQKEDGGKFIQPFFIGIFLFMVFFNVFYFIISGWKVYLQYAVYIFLSLLFFSHYFGILQLVFPILARVSNNLIWILSSVIATSYVLFISKFGEFEKLNKRAHRIFQFGIYFKCVQIPTEVVLWLLGFNFIHTQQYLMVVMAVEISIVLIGFYHLLISPLLRARVIVGASFILFAASMVGQLNPFANLDRVIIIETGTLIEILIFSVSLALKAKEMDRNRLKVAEQLLEKTQENIRIQEGISAELEKQVKERTISLEIRNKENEVLLAEIHHRIKNNLQFISSLINLQINQVQDQKAREALALSRERIKAIGTIHETLYLSHNFGFISFVKYLQDIIASLTLHGEGSNSTPTFDLQMADIMISREDAIPLGLILLELITNSMKHTHSTNLQITIRSRLVSGRIDLEYFDNGPEQESIKSGFGTSIISLLTKQLKGEVQHKNFRYRFGFPSLHIETRE